MAYTFYACSDLSDDRTYGISSHLVAFRLDDEGRKAEIAGEQSGPLLPTQEAMNRIADACTWYGIPHPFVTPRPE